MFTHFKEIEAFMESRKAFGIKPGLERMHKLLHFLNHPERCFKTVHVAGTNGKGSTIQFMKQALRTNGYRVGVFTSPSLSGLPGHIWCNEQVVEKDEWISIMNNIYPTIKQMDAKENHPTSFEIITAVAFVFFSRDVDIALVETGMGGRYDTTNYVHPILSIITNVALDHTAFLGNNLEDIAYHKAGIMKQDTPVILGDMEEDIFPVFQQEAFRKHAPMYQLFHQFTYEDIVVTSRGQNFMWKYKGTKQALNIRMRGRHQVKNASLAIMALALLHSLGMKLDWQQNVTGINSTTLPGRFETVQEYPDIIIDGAHNPAGAESFIRTVHAVYPTEEKHILFAAYKDKDIQTMLDVLSPYFQTITLTSFPDQRAASSLQLYNMTNHSYKMDVPDWKEAIRQIKAAPNNGGNVYFISGSLAFITQARAYILNENNNTF